MGSSFSLGDMGSDATVREYFEIPNIEIMASEKKEGAVSVGDMVNVYILSSGNQFHLSFVLGAESDLLKRLMNKRVSSSDELVKNLKEFFKNTDWMYLPMEKDIYAAKPTTEPAPIDKPAPPKKVTPRITGRVQKKVTTQLHDKIESQSMKYFTNLYEKGLITEEIYSRLMEQYKGTSKGPVTPLMKTDAEEPPSQVETPIVETAPEPIPEVIPEPEPMQAPSNEPAAEQQPPSGIEAEPPVTDIDESDDDLLGMLSDTLADMGDGQEAVDSPPPQDVEGSEVPPDPEVQPGSEEVQAQPPAETAPKKVARKVKQMTVRRD